MMDSVYPQKLIVDKSSHFWQLGDLQDDKSID